MTSLRQKFRQTLTIAFVTLGGLALSAQAADFDQQAEAINALQVDQAVETQLNSPNFVVHDVGRSKVESDTVYTLTAEDVDDTNLVALTAPDQATFENRRHQVDEFDNNLNTVATAANFSAENANLANFGASPGNAIVTDEARVLQTVELGDRLIS